MKSIKFIPLLMLFLAFSYTSRAQADIAITEWITNPSVNDATDEWVELYNFGAIPVDIQNWRIQDEDADDDVITASSFIIPAGGYVIIAKNKVAFETQWLSSCPNADVIEVAGLILANGTDEIIIRDASNTIVWSIAYMNDDVSGIAAHYTEIPTFTNRVWGSKAAPGVDRAGNDPATATLGYENNNTTADPNVMTSTTGDMGSPFDGTIPCCVTFSAPAGTTNTWMGCVDDDWSNGLNWSTGIVPTASDVIYVPANANTPLVINEIATCAKMIVEIGGVCTIDYNAGGKLVVKF